MGNRCKKFFRLLLWCLQEILTFVWLIQSPPRFQTKSILNEISCQKKVRNWIVGVGEACVMSCYMTEKFFFIEKSVFVKNSLLLTFSSCLRIFSYVLWHIREIKIFLWSDVCRNFTLLFDLFMFCEQGPLVGRVA